METYRKYLCLLILCLAGAFALTGRSVQAASTGSAKAVEGKFVKKGNYTYFQQKNGQLLRGWLTWKGHRYYLSMKNGARVTGWRNIGGKRYFFQLNNGKMATGWFSYHKKKYFASPKGILKKGWLTYQGGRYFLSYSQKGAMRTGWVKIKGKKYFFQSDGRMAVKTWVDDKHYVGKDGVLDPKAVQKKKDTFRWPLDRSWSQISSPFGYRGPMPVGTSDHNGIDIPAPTNTPVYAGRAGVVTICQYSESAGNYVEIKHGNGLVTQYMHMNSFKTGMKVGKRVKRGQVIGYVGSTGWSTGPHLHFGVKINSGYYADPLEYTRQP